MNTNISKLINDLQYNQRPIKNRLQNYVVSSKSMLTTAAVIGSTVGSTAAIQNIIDFDPIINKTFIAGGGGTGGNQVLYDITQSQTTGDGFRFTGGNPGGNISAWVEMFGSAEFFNDSGSPSIARYYQVGDTVDGNGSTGNFGYLAKNGNLGAWIIDRLAGAVGFKNADGEFGFVNISWVAATSTFTVLGGKFDDTPGTPIVVSAIGVPEPSDYAALLGLGAVGIAAYRRRPGNKVRGTKQNPI